MNWSFDTQSAGGDNNVRNFGQNNGENAPSDQFFRCGRGGSDLALYREENDKIDPRKNISKRFSTSYVY